METPSSFFFPSPWLDLILAMLSGCFWLTCLPGVLGGLVPPTGLTRQAPGWMGAFLTPEQAWLVAHVQLCGWAPQTLLSSPDHRATDWRSCVNPHPTLICASTPMLRQNTLKSIPSHTHSRVQGGSKACSGFKACHCPLPAMGPLGTL